MGRILIIAGIIFLVVGLLFVGGDRLGIPFGRLPGDIRVEGRRGGFYFPIVTCLILSAVLTLISWLFRR